MTKESEVLQNEYSADISRWNRAKATPVPTDVPTPTPTAATMQSITGGVGTNIGSMYTAALGIYVKVSGSNLTNLVAQLGAVTINDVANVPSASGNSATNGNAIYFKLATGTTLHVNDVIKVVINGTTYTYTVAN